MLLRNFYLAIQEMLLILQSTFFIIILPKAIYEKFQRSMACLASSSDLHHLFIKV